MPRNTFHESVSEYSRLETAPEFEYEDLNDKDTNHPGSVSGDDSLRPESHGDDFDVLHEDGQGRDECISSSDESSFNESEDQSSDDDVDD
ncbi:hypothetical protein N7478_008034 [Penicillium angulare]|uniref:uncharacterized protein n=1 Tax=Penicillium angulare TaxID=116970 RepID=UPI00254023E0|nr:uncharacterized protein N7478_008034 [Penicillium angulare]KAJ5272909.1 hypothetical protein N7478_008034 [Penicillium angulare]